MRFARKHALALGAFFAFALMPLFTRGAGASVLAIAAWRAVLVAVIFGAWAAATGGGLAALKPDRKTLGLGVGYGLAQAVASATFVGGYAFTTVANTIFLHNLAPVAVFPLAWWAFKERPSPAALTGAAVAVAGVAMLSGVSLFQFTHFANPRFLLGDLLALTSAGGYAAVLVFTRATRQEGTPILGTLFVAWSVAAVVLVLIALAAGQLAVPPASLLWILGLAIVSTNLPFYLLNLSMREIGAGLASVLSMSEVVFATLVGMAVFSEHLSPLGWIGGGLVVAGVLYPLTQGEEGERPAGAAADFPPGALPWRLGRLALGLLLLNGGAAVLLLEGSPVGALLAWAGLAALLRLGLHPALSVLEGRFAAALRWGGALLAAVVLGGLALRGGWDSPKTSVAAAALAGLALLLELSLAEREAAAQGEAHSDAGGEASGAFDPAPLLRLALGLTAAGQLLGAADHPAGRWLAMGGGAALALMAWGVLLAGVRGHLPARPAHSAQGVLPLDRLPATLSRPAVAVPAAAVLLLGGGIYAVPAGHRAVVERLGAPMAEAAPGLLLRLPPPLEQVTLVDVDRVRRAPLEDGTTPMLCGDQSMLSLSAWLHYTVADSSDWVFGALAPEAALTELARAELVAAVSRQPHDAVLTDGREALQREVAAAVQAAAERAGLGVAVEEVLLLEVSVPAPVQAAFLDVISAEEEKRTAVNTAEAWAADLLPVARGNADAKLTLTEAEAALLLARADAEAERFAARVAGGAAAPESLRVEAGWEAAEAALGPAELILTPPGVRVWLGGDARKPRVAEDPR
jgi:drug/metabolite transporter (DMT)-like permease/regulator of protease activity HflC (stomatin/prohibitin superfamily)